MKNHALILVISSLRLSISLLSKNVFLFIRLGISLLNESIIHQYEFTGQTNFPEGAFPGQHGQRSFYHLAKYNLPALGSEDV